MWLDCDDENWKERKEYDIYSITGAGIVYHFGKALYAATPYSFAQIGASQMRYIFHFSVLDISASENSNMCVRVHVKWIVLA